MLKVFKIWHLTLFKKFNIDINSKMHFKCLIYK